MPPTDPADCFDPLSERIALRALACCRNVGYSTNVDRGMGCGIHPRSKQFCAERLGHSALAIANNRSEFSAWRSPSYVSATTRTANYNGASELDHTSSAAAAVVSVEVSKRSSHVISPT
jgi:hypothetical protein